MMTRLDRQVTRHFAPVGMLPFHAPCGVAATQFLLILKVIWKLLPREVGRVLSICGAIPDRQETFEPKMPGKKRINSAKLPVCGTSGVEVGDGEGWARGYGVPIRGACHADCPRLDGGNAPTLLRSSISSDEIIGDAHGTPLVASAGDNDKQVLGTWFDVESDMRVAKLPKMLGRDPIIDALCESRMKDALPSRNIPAIPFDEFARSLENSLETLHESSKTYFFDCLKDHTISEMEPVHD